MELEVKRQKPSLASGHPCTKLLTYSNDDRKSIPSQDARITLRIKWKL